MVNKTKSDRIIKKPVEMYHQDCILKAAVMQNRCVHASKRSLFSLNLSQSSLGWSRPGAEKTRQKQVKTWHKGLDEVSDDPEITFSEKEGPGTMLS